MSPLPFIPYPHYSLFLAVRAEMQQLSLDTGRWSCIEAVAAMVDGAVALELPPISPLTARARVSNPVSTHQMGRLELPPGQLPPEGEPVTHIVGWLDDARGWPGHLVAIAPDPEDANVRILLDPTLEQANNPNHGIAVRATGGRIGSRDLERTSVIPMLVNQCLVQYEIFPTQKFFETTTLWLDQEARERTLKRVLHRLDGT